jgi:hypothetical protein
MMQAEGEIFEVDIPPTIGARYTTSVQICQNPANTQVRENKCLLLCNTENFWFFLWFSSIIAFVVS